MPNFIIIIVCITYKLKISFPQLETVTADKTHPGLETLQEIAEKEKFFEVDIGSVTSCLYYIFKYGHIEI